MVLARVAHADDVDDLVARGEDLAKQGEWSRAIDAFKAADAKRQSAKHACLIGLAYTRRELWGEAELFLDTCQQRANTGDPAPEWLAEALHTLADKLTAANAAPIAISVVPDDAKAEISVSSFAPGETFAPRTIHLTPGTHTLRVTAPGYYAAAQEVTVAAGAPQSLVIHLRKLPTPFVRRVPYLVMAAGGALAIGALAYDQYELQPVIKQMQKSNAEYDANIGVFHTRQDVTIGLFAGAAVVVAGGIVLRYVIGRDVGVTAGVDSRGAVVGLTWRR
jgi:hypothetical protein